MHVFFHPKNENLLKGINNQTEKKISNKTKAFLPKNVLVGIGVVSVTVRNDIT